MCTGIGYYMLHPYPPKVTLLFTTILCLLLALCAVFKNVLMSFHSCNLNFLFSDDKTSLLINNTHIQYYPYGLYSSHLP